MGSNTTATWLGTVYKVIWHYAVMTRSKWPKIKIYGKENTCKYRFRRILHDECCQFVAHVNAAYVSTGNAALRDAVLFHQLSQITSHTNWPSCGFTSHSTQNTLFRRRFPKPISWLDMEKINLTQQKHAFTNQKKCSTTQNKHKKIKPGLGAFYNIRPGNGAGLFSKKKISKEKVEKTISEREAYNINKQTIYIAPKSKIESRAHYDPEPARGR